jgi:hypothetical protein
VRCGWELSVLVYGLHARRDGLEVGQTLCGAGGWGCLVWYCRWRLCGCGMWGGGVGCWCAVMARCGRGAGETNVWASDLDSGERLVALVQDVRTIRRCERSRLWCWWRNAAMRRGCGGVGRRDERVYSREPRRIVVWGMREWRGSRLQSGAAAVGGGRADGGTGGSGRSMGCVKGVSVLVYGLHARRDGLEVRSILFWSGWLGVCGVVSRMVVCGDDGCGVVVWVAGVR